jgi:hypothetical protein
MRCSVFVCVQFATGLLTSLPTVESVLDHHASALGHDYRGYRNHVYRVVNLCLAVAGDRRVELEKIAVAADHAPEMIHTA